MKYYLINNDPRNEDGVIIDEAPINGPKEYEYFDLLELKNRFPKVGKSYFSQNYKDSTKLYDSIDNICNLIIVSSRTVEIIKGFQENGVEYLPIELFNHNREKVECDTYYFINGLIDIDYIDLEKTRYRMSRMIENRIKKIKGDLFIKDCSIPSGCHLFRSSIYPKQYVVSEVLKNELLRNDITGLIFTEVLTS